MICAMCAGHAAEPHHPRSSGLGSTEVHHPRKVSSANYSRVWWHWCRWGASADLVPYTLGLWHSGHDPSLRGLAAIHDYSLCTLSDVARHSFVQLSANTALMESVQKVSAGTLSNVFWKSRMIRSACCLSSRRFCSRCTVVASWVSQLNPCWNPCCKGFMVILFV